MCDPLVLLPDMMSDYRLFEPQILALGRERPIIVVPTNLHDRIDDIAKFVLAAAPARFSVLGHGMGGVVAMEVLQRGGDRISRLGLMSTHPLPETPTDAANREPQIISARAGRLAEVMDQLRRPEFLAPGPQRMTVLQSLKTMALDLGPVVFERQSRALQRRRDQQGTLRRSKVPVAVFCGELDVVCPVKRHTSMAELAPNATLHLIPNAGHWPTLEQPQDVTDVLQAWLAAPLGSESEATTSRLNAS